MTGSELTLLRIFLNLEQEIEEAFGELIDEPWGRTFRAEWSPAVDIDETSEYYIVAVDVPGICEDDIELYVRPREIEIRGTRTVTRSVASASHIHTERFSGRFRRRFQLEETIDTQSAECECENGVYQVRLRKLRDNNDHEHTTEG